MKPLVSIIVPVYNEEKNLPDCLDSLINLALPKDELEIIIVDNNSTDSSKEIINSYPVRYAFESRRSRGAARNRGIKEARGEFLAFTDADCLVDKNWLTEIMKGFTSEDIAGCGGEIVHYKSDKLIERYSGFRYEFPQKIILVNKEFLLPFAGTCNLVYRWKAVEEAGYFDPLFVTAEDADLSYRLFLRGYRLNYLPDAIVRRKGPDRLWSLLNKCYEYGYYFSYLRRKYKFVFKKSIVSCNDCLELFLKLWQSARVFFISLFKERLSEKVIFPIIDISVYTAWFAGRIYALLRLKTGREEEISLQLNPGRVFWRAIEDEVAIIDCRSGLSYILNGTGARIWRLLAEGKDIPRIAGVIADEYKVDKEEARADVISLIDKLKKKNLLSDLRREVVYSKRSAQNLIQVSKSAGPGVEGSLRLELNNEWPYVYSVDPGEDFSKKTIFNICCVLPLLGEVRKVLLLGLGPGVILTRMKSFYKELVFDGVEIDPEIVEVGYRYFGLEKDPRSKIFIGDGRDFLESTKNSYDLIINDVSKQGEVPYRLRTYQYFRLAYNHLNHKGILFCNIFDVSSGSAYKSRTGSIAKTAGRVFPAVFFIPDCCLLLAFKERISLREFKRRLEEAPRHPGLDHITRWVALKTRKFRWRITDQVLFDLD